MSEKEGQPPEEHMRSFGRQNGGNNEKRIPKPSRRSVISALGAGGLTTLAGCGSQDPTATQTTAAVGDEDVQSTPTETSTSTPREQLAHVEGQTLRLNLTQNPERVTFMLQYWFPGVWNYGDGSWLMPWDMMGTIVEPGAFGRWGNTVINTGGVENRLYDEISFSPEAIEVSIRDGVKWSNGDPLTGKDCVVLNIMRRMLYSSAPLDGGKQRKGVDPALTDVEYDDGSFTLKSSWGGWPTDTETGRKYILKNQLCGFTHFSNPNYNTDAHPYDKYTQPFFDLWERAQNGEVDPTSKSRVPFIMDELLADKPMNEWIKDCRKGENVHTIGAWTLDEIRGAKEIVFKPNEYHRHADKVNFDQVIYTYNSENRAAWAALKSNTLDHYHQTVKKNVVDSFPDNIEQRLKPQSMGGVALEMDHGSEFFEDPRSRRAFMHLMNPKEIANAESSIRNIPVEVPFGDAWGANKYLPKSWREENLRNYQETGGTERAAELLRQAGWSKDGESWTLPSGEPASLTIPAPSASPSALLTVRQQLRDFGIDADVQSYESATYWDRVDTGKFTLRREDWGSGVGFLQNALPTMWYYIVYVGFWLNQRTRMFPQEMIEEAEYPQGSGDQLGLLEDRENFEIFEVEAPPIGEWDGSLQTYKPAALGWDIVIKGNTMSESKLESHYKKMAWVSNWWLPKLPIALKKRQFQLDTGHWHWPEEKSVDWDAVGIEDVQTDYLIGMGDKLFANPDNPEEGATVQD